MASFVRMLMIMPPPQRCDPRITAPPRQDGCPAGRLRPRAVVMIAVMALSCFSLSVSAMEFSIMHNSAQNIDFIYGEGDIIDGDAQRLEAILHEADRDQFGNYALVLNSMGGSVSAAFEMVEVMDREEFTVVIPSGTVCASACATVVYISARLHEVTGTGLLGLHSCYTGGRPVDEPEPSSFCNRLIAENAVDHGTSYGAIIGWMQFYGPEDVAWLGKDVACEFGLCGPPGADLTLAEPSFSCGKATSPSEVAICSDRRLARYDASISNTYFAILKRLPEAERTQFRNEQREWLRLRDDRAASDCGSCLLETMKERLGALRLRELQLAIPMP